MSEAVHRPGMCVTRPPGGGQLKSTCGTTAAERRPERPARAKTLARYRVLRAAPPRGGPRSVDRDCAGRNADVGVKGLSPENRIVSVMAEPVCIRRRQHSLARVSVTGVLDHGMYRRPVSKRERSAEGRAGAPRPRLRDARQGVNAESASILTAEVRCLRSSDEAGQCPWSEGGHGE